MIKQLHQKLLLLSMLLLAGTNLVWADSYTITFGNSVKSATAISSTTKATTVIKEGTDYVTNQPFTVNSGIVYYGDTQTCIRLGKSGNASSLTIALSDAGKVKASSIVVNCNNPANNKNSNVKLSVNGSDQQTTTGEAADYTFSIGSAIESITLAADKSLYIYSITVNIQEDDGKTDIASINGITPTKVNIGDLDDFVLDATFVDGTVANEDYEVNWESDNTDVLEVAGSTYEAKKVGTANVTVSVTVLDDTKYNEVSKTFAVKVVDPNANDGSLEKPYTVAEMLELLDEGDCTNTHVAGYVSKIDEVSIQNGNATYYLADAEGDTDNVLEVFRGKYFDAANFTSDNQIAVGDKVIVSGDTYIYTQKSIKEFKLGSKIVSQVRKATISDSPAATANSSVIIPFVENEKMQAELTVERSLSADYWNTIYLPFALSAEQIEAAFGAGTKVAAYSGSEDTNFKFSSVSEMAANTAYIIQPAEAVASFTLEGATLEEAADDVVSGSYGFVGTLDSKTFGEDNGVLYIAKDNQIKTLQANGTMNALRGYFQKGEDGQPAAEGRTFTFTVDDTATGISLTGVKVAGMTDGARYNLAGQRVARGYKGIVIENGKKVIIK